MLLAGKTVSIADLYDSLHLFHGYSDGGILVAINEALGFIKVHEGHNIEIVNRTFLITSHVAWMWIAVFIISAIFIVAARSKPTEKGAPRGLRNFLEPMLTFLRDEVVRPSISDPHHHDDDHGDGGDHHDHKPTHKYADALFPYFVTVFFFIMVMNLLGLFPGAGTVTSSITVTACLAIVVMLIYIIGGMILQKPRVIGFFKGIVPSCPLPVWPILFGIEVIGLLTKPFALCVRLFANMTAGGIVLLALVGLSAMAATDAIGVGLGTLPMLMAVAIYALKIFVSILQAYIFTFLAAIFIGSYLVPDH